MTHRIVDKNDGVIITKGDNNNEKDIGIEENQILGKVVFSSILLGTFIRKYLKYVFIVFTIFIVMINILFCVKEKKSGKVKDKIP